LILVSHGTLSKLLFMKFHFRIDFFLYDKIVFIVIKNT
jgi:hypothetical protein